MTLPEPYGRLAISEIVKQGSFALLSCRSDGVHNDIKSSFIWFLCDGMDGFWEAVYEDALFHFENGNQ